MRLEVTVPIRILSEANQRCGWWVRHKRNSEHKVSTAWALATFSLMPSERLKLLPASVTLTRIAPRTLDDDNNVSGFKALRDGVAKWFGVDDADPRLTWCYGQEKGKPKEYAARITIEAA